MNLAFIFPGQGSQSVGMLDSYTDHPAVIGLLRTANHALGEDLGRLIAQGPADALNLTVNTQPAMLVAGLANHMAWVEAGGPPPIAVAGHSLGEYTALTAAGVLDAGAAVRLVRLRARAMQEAVPVGQGSMAAILGLDDAAVKEACSRALVDHGDEVVAPANFNAPSQVVIAGHKGAVDRACEHAKALGAKRALPLSVSAPFHSSLLAPAGERLAEALSKLQLNRPKFAVVNNVDVAVCHEPAQIVDALIRQSYNPVRWVEVVHKLKTLGAGHLIEFGPGRVLAGLVPRIDKTLKVSAVYDATTLAAVLAEVRGTTLAAVLADVRGTAP